MVFHKTNWENNNQKTKKSKVKKKAWERKPHTQTQTQRLCVILCPPIIMAMQFWGWVPAPLPIHVLVASQLRVKVAERDGEGEKRRQRVPEIHGENVLRDLPKLENNLLAFGPRRPVLRGSHQLKVLDRSDRYPSVKVQTPALELLVPSGCLVFEDQGSTGSTLGRFGRGFRSEEGYRRKRIVTDDREMGLCGGHASRFYWRCRNSVHDTLHFPWTPVSKPIQLVWNVSYFIVSYSKSRVDRFQGFRISVMAFYHFSPPKWRWSIIYRKLAPQKIWPHFANIIAICLGHITGMERYNIVRASCAPILASSKQKLPFISQSLSQVEVEVKHLRRTAPLQKALHQMVSWARLLDCNWESNSSRSFGGMGNLLHDLPPAPANSGTSHHAPPGRPLLLRLLHLHQHLPQ